MAAPTLHLAPDEHSGRKLGKYEILCRLSTGGMSEIFLAFQRGLAGFRKHVVLKQILPDIKGEEEFVRMFLDEARITAAFTHPNIAQTFDLDIQEGELFLAMEFVPGATLVEIARAVRQANEPIPIGFTLQAVRDTAVALHYAHTFTDPLGRPQTVIHRDIAEKNIMVTYEGVTKLLDFGIAKALGRSSRTSVGMVKGTSGYMSPEQILGEQLDARSDVFALGVVLHECLTGMRLFHGKTAEDAMMQALKGDVAPPSAQNKSLPPELDAVTLKALQRKRDDRYATALEFARAIERAASQHIWHPEQSGPFVTRLFAQRLEATRKLMSEASSQISEATGEFKLAKLLGNDLPPPVVKAPPPLPEPVTEAQAAKPRASAAQPKPSPLPLEPKTIPQHRREAPASPPPPPAAALEERESQPRKRPSPKVKEELTTPGIRPEQIGLGPAADPSPGERTLPATSLADLLSAPTPGAAKLRSSIQKKPATDPPAKAKPNTSPPKKVSVSDLETTESGATRLNTDESIGGTTTPDGRMPGKKGRAMLIAVAVGCVAAIGGTMFALGLHQDIARSLGIGGGENTEAQAAANGPKPGDATPIRPPPTRSGPPTNTEPSGRTDVVAKYDSGDHEKASPAPTPTQGTPAAAGSADEKAPAGDAKPAAEAKPNGTLDAELEPLVANAKPQETLPAAPEEKQAPKKATVTPASAKRRAPKSDDGDATSSGAGSWDAPAAKSESKPAGTGTLTLVTEPFSTVYLNGKELGQTPLVKFELGAGKHTLKLVGEDNKKFALPVEIKADEETKVRVPLSVLKTL